MSDPSQPATCAVCGQPLPQGRGDCPGCGASDRWQDLTAALEFARARFLEWAKTSTIGAGPSDAIAKDCDQRRATMVQMAGQRAAVPAEMPLLPRDRCWSCRSGVAPADVYCPGCGVPVGQPDVESLRYWTYTCHLIKAHCDAGRLPLVQAHASMNDAKSRIAALRNRLERQRLVLAEAAGEPAVASAGTAGTAGQASSGATVEKSAGAAHPPRRPFWEILLDPRTIQWLLGFGGALLVLGLVIWLAAHGVFKNPLVVAVILGAANLAVLGGGGAIIRFSRYQTAGRAITLLACLVMPLNLWFYQANNLVTIGGNLWVAALVCCVLYLAAALVLRDHLFVYVLCGGVAMTGLLMLADAGRFWEIAAPATLLVVLGLIAMHAERAFPEVEGPFSRKRFGLAFFQSGHALLAAGLLLVLGTQIVGDWLWKPVFERLYTSWHVLQPALVREWGRFLALALILAGAYAYFYSDIVVRRVGLYVYLGVFTLLWAEMYVIELAAPTMVAEVAILALALTALVVNLVQPRLAPRWRENLPAGGKPDNLAAAAVSLVRAGQPLGLFLSTVPVLLGLVLHLRATYVPLNELWHLPGSGPYQIGWMYVLAMLATAVSCRMGAHLYRRTLPWLSAVYFFGTAAATLCGVTGLLSVLGIRSWDELAPLVMIVPILYLIAARLYRGHSQENPLVWVAHAATGVLIASVLAAAAGLTPEHVAPPSGQPLNLLLAAFFAEAALFYVLAAAFRKQGFNVYLATAAASGALWQLLQYWAVGPEYYTLIFAALGLLLLAGYRLAMLEWTRLAGAAFQCANALMSLSLVAAVLITLSRLAAAQEGHAGLHYSLVLLLVGLVALSLLAAWLVQHAAWRRWYVVMAIAEAALAFLTLHLLSNLTAWEKLEIFSIVVGVALLVVAHVGWRREQDGQNDLVSFGLFFGSLLVGLPLVIAVLVHRCRPTPDFSTLNELGMLSAGIVLLGTGFAFQLRATTIAGASLLTVYLVSLLAFINALENVETAAIWMMIGGAVIVGSAVALSIYRDRLLTLPERVRRREGVFRVLSWR